MSRFFARLAISIALVLIALVAAMIAVGYFVFALYLWLAENFVPPAAAVIAGLIVVLTALFWFYSWVPYLAGRFLGGTGDVQGVRAAIECALSTREDRHFAGGETY